MEMEMPRRQPGLNHGTELFTMYLLVVLGTEKLQAITNIHVSTKQTTLSLQTFRLPSLTSQAAALYTVMQSVTTKQQYRFTIKEQAFLLNLAAPTRMMPSQPTTPIPAALVFSPEDLKFFIEWQK